VSRSLANYTFNTAKYHESVDRIGSSAEGMSTNTLNKQVIFRGI